jgi:hypothetical protein
MEFLFEAAAFAAFLAIFGVIATLLGSDSRQGFAPYSAGA